MLITVLDINIKLIYHAQCRHSLMRTCGDGVGMGTVFTGQGSVSVLVQTSKLRFVTLQLSR